MINYQPSKKTFIIPSVGLLILLIYIFIDSVIQSRITYYRNIGEGNSANELVSILTTVHVSSMILVILMIFLSILNVFIEITPNNNIRTQNQSNESEDFKLINEEQLEKD